MVLTNVGAESRARVEIVMAISRVPGPHIRPASAADAPAIHVASWKVTYASMVGNVGMDAHTPDDRLLMWMRILGDPESPAHVWVAEIDGTVSGFCSIGPARTMAGAGELYTIYLDPGREGHGLGHALITRAEAGMAEGGYTHAILWVLRDNAVARRFYDRHGWRPDGQEIADEIFGRPVTEVRYTKSLAGASSGSANS